MPNAALEMCKTHREVCKKVRGRKRERKTDGERKKKRERNKRKRERKRDRENEEERTRKRERDMYRTSYDFIWPTLCRFFTDTFIASSLLLRLFFVSPPSLQHCVKMNENGVNQLDKHCVKACNKNYKACAGEAREKRQSKDGKNDEEMESIL